MEEWMIVYLDIGAGVAPVLRWCYRSNRADWSVLSQGRIIPLQTDKDIRICIRRCFVTSSIKGKIKSSTCNLPKKEKNVVSHYRCYCVFHCTYCTGQCVEELVRIVTDGTDSDIWLPRFYRDVIHVITVYCMWWDVNGFSNKLFSA